MTNYQPYGLTPEQEKILERIADSLETLAKKADNARTYLIPPSGISTHEIDKVFDTLAKYGDLTTILLPPGWSVRRGHKTTGKPVVEESTRRGVTFVAEQRGSEESE